MSSKVKINEDGTIQVKDVRLSYPHLFTPWNQEEGKPKKYAGRFILPKSTHGPEIKVLQNHLVELQKEYFKARIPLANMFLRNGDDLGRPEYEGAWYIAASETIRPQVVGKRREVLDESDDVVYGGCFVNVLIRPWKQDNKHGKKINANLIAVQFVRDGERFGQARPDINEHFEDEDGEGGSGDDGGFEGEGGGFDD